MMEWSRVVALGWTPHAEVQSRDLALSVGCLPACLPAAAIALGTAFFYYLHHSFSYFCYILFWWADNPPTRSCFTARWKFNAVLYHQPPPPQQNGLKDKNPFFPLHHLAAVPPTARQGVLSSFSLVRTSAIKYITPPTQTCIQLMKLDKIHFNARHDTNQSDTKSSFFFSLSLLFDNYFF